ncbi:MAG: sialidase family protein [Saprospiraceae bacterium]
MLLILPILLMLFSCKESTYKNVLIHENDNKGFGPCEPSIFINPKNPKNMVAGAVLDSYHYSFDAGETWKMGRLQSSHGVYGDPCITADNDGNFYYFHLADPEGTNWKSSRILESIIVQKSTDGGVSWNDGSAIGANPPKQQDKEWSCVNPNNNNIYTTWTQFDKYGSKEPDCKSLILFSMSSDGGITWSDPARLSELPGNCIDDDNTVEGAVPAVGWNDDVYVAWSFDDRIHFDRSLDGGKTWLEKDLEVAAQPGGWDMTIPGIGRANGMPVTRVDLSDSPHKGTIYINWADARNGEDNTDIFLAYSKDKGNTWSDPIKVNNDLTKTHQFFPWMDVDPVTGAIYVVFYDRSKYDDQRTDVVLASSTDGGKTWKNETISEKPFGAPGEFVFFGDYNNISAYDGKVRPIWTSYNNKKLSIWTALINKKVKKIKP